MDRRPVQAAPVGEGGPTFACDHRAPVTAADHHRDPQRTLGSAVRVLRHRRGLSQAALAERSGVELSLVARVEAGEVDPTWGDTRRIAAALGTTVDRLAELVEELEAGEG
jgi:ribosome-binding protein aMBF1 (putative translation factor)